MRLTQNPLEGSSIKLERSRVLVPEAGKGFQKVGETIFHIVADRMAIGVVD